MVAGVLIALIAISFVTSFMYRSLISTDADIRYVVHATIVDGEDTYVGQGVWDLHLEQARLLSHDMVRSVRGEAIELHGSNGESLFLLRSPRDGGSNREYGDFPMQCVPGAPKTNIEVIDNMRSMFVGPCFADSQDLPQIVRLTDLGNPSTIVPLHYGFIRDGACPGACLTELWVERTSNPITIGIADRLPWIKRFQYGMTNVATGEVPKFDSGEIGVFRLMDFTTEFPGGRNYE